MWCSGENRDSLSPIEISCYTRSYTAKRYTNNCKQQYHKHIKLELIIIVDEASDIEACQMLTINAKNLTSAISEALYHTQSASLRVSKETRMELGLIQPDIRDIIGKINQCHKVIIAT